MINVVSVSVLLPRVEMRLLILVPRIVPVLVERHDFGDPHCKYEVILATIGRTTSSDDPIADIRETTNLRLASCKTACSSKWIWCKSEIARDNVDEHGSNTDT